MRRAVARGRSRSPRCAPRARRVPAARASCAASRWSAPSPSIRRSRGRAAPGGPPARRSSRRSSLAARSLLADATGQEPAPDEPPAAPGRARGLRRELPGPRGPGRAGRTLADGGHEASGREYVGRGRGPGRRRPPARAAPATRAPGGAPRRAAAPAGPSGSRSSTVPSPAVLDGGPRRPASAPGHASVVPLELEAGRALVEVDAPGSGRPRASSACSRPQLAGRPRARAACRRGGSPPRPGPPRSRAPNRRRRPKRRSTPPSEPVEAPSDAPAD